MTGWAVLEALGVGIAVLLLALLLLYVPFRWWPVGLYLLVPLCRRRFTPFIAAPGCLFPCWGADWLVVAGRARRARHCRGLHRDGAPGPGAGRPDWGPRPRLGRPHPQPASGEDGGPRVARAAADHSEPRLRQDVVFATVRGRGASCCVTCGTPSRVCLRRGWPWSTCTAAPGASGQGRRDAAAVPPPGRPGPRDRGQAYRLFPETDIPGMAPTPSGRWPG